jgi:cytochrome P450
MSKILVEGKLSGNPYSLYRGFQRDPIQFLVDTRIHGDLVRIPSVTGQASYIVHHPEIVRAVLAVDEPKTVKGPSGKILGYTLGRGLLTSDNPEHSAQRRRMQPAFHAQMLAGTANEIVQLTDARLTDWNVNHPVSVSSELLDLTLDVVFHTLFGAEVGEDRARLHDIIEYSVNFSAKKLLSALRAPMWMPTKGNRAHHLAMKSFDEIIHRLMGEGEVRTSARLDEFVNHEASLRPLKPGNLLDYLYLMREMNEGDPADGEIRDQLATLIIGGHETTANLLSWVLFLLAKHPQVYEKLCEEIDQSLEGRFPTFEDTRQLNYTRMVLKEALRLYPPAWTILRETTAEITVNNLQIPAKSSLIVSPYVIHRSPDSFEWPDEFIPERFAKSPHPWDSFAYIPFGAGSRTCIGNTFAMMEATLILSMMAQRFTFHIPDGTVVQPEPSVSLRIKGGLKMRVATRTVTFG